MLYHGTLELTHLGNFFNSRLDNNVDTNHKCSHFISQDNHMSNFGHLNPENVVTLFKSYCCSFYGSFLWKYNSDSFGKCCTQWNKCIRRLYYLPYNTHRWLLAPLIGQYHIRHQLILRVSTSFITVNQFYCQRVYNERIFQCEYIDRI